MIVSSNEVGAGKGDKKGNPSSTIPYMVMQTKD